MAVARMVIRGVVPFYGGTSSATHSLEETRLEYLRQTRESLEAHGILEVVYQTKRDKVDVPGSVRLDVPPIWLPYAACVETQKWMRSVTDVALVYYTEADQILHIHDEEVYDLATEEQYVAPWRLDKVGPNGECEVPGSEQYVIEGEAYAIANGGHLLAHASDQWGVFDVHGQQQAFSGAYLATRDYFNRIPFRKMHVLPVEHASGFDAKSIGDCVKTQWLERFWIDHLSPRDRWGAPPTTQESDTQ